MGSVEPYESAEGRRYRVRYRKPDRSQTDKRGFRTKRDAELFLASVEVRKSVGDFIDPVRSKISIGDLGQEWLESQSHLKPSAYRAVEVAWRLHVKPAWARVPLNQVWHSDVQTWVSGLTRRRSATTTLRAYGVLMSIIDQAVRDRRLTTNPGRGVNLPKKTRKERAYLTHKQLETLAGLCRKHRLLVLFLGYSGLRWGEATALRVRDLDPPRNRVRVNRNAVMVGGSIVVGTPKSNEGRSVPLPPSLVIEVLDAIENKGPDNLIFGDGFTFVRPPDSRRGWWKVAVAQCVTDDPSFPSSLTRHDLRHTAASLAVSAGANVKVLQRMLGHKSAAMTLDVYSDLFDDDLDAVGEAMDEARHSSRQ